MQAICRVWARWRRTAGGRLGSYDQLKVIVKQNKLSTVLTTLRHIAAQQGHIGTSEELRMAARTAGFEERIAQAEADIEAGR